VLIPENKILKLNDTNIFGFHPSLRGLQSLYNDELLTVIQGVGYPNPDFSHFRGIAIKSTANTDKMDIGTGWLGRYLEHEYPNFPQGYPLHPVDGPPAIRYGIVSPKITQGKDENYSIGILSISDFNNLSGESHDDPVPNTMGGENIMYIRSMANELKLYAPVIRTTAKKQETLSKLYPEPEKNPLADDLKMVAKLIGGGLNSNIFVVHQPGYDTHADQVDKSDPTRGKHAELLADLSEAITAFEDDLHLMGKQDEVLGMTYSEFGRRIASSDSYGTDHGTAESVVIFGTKLKKGIIGASPDLPSKVTSNDNLSFQFDFRTLYKTILIEWLGVSNDFAKAIIPQGPDNKIDIFKV
jgi:uncharacterized protein (DUF1501 family)